ncbi:hypothetical protein RhiirB3_430406 [Rhizophagus irregularis]|nr:hypothetical protein RhiirB3_430406 [Rhizophagus irregularis]
MFEAINSSSFPGVNYKTQITRKCYFPKPQDFDNNDIIEETLSHKVLGYLDNTTWLAENIEDLENNLMIANNFYELANIHINKDKSFILVNRHARKISSRIIAANPPYIDIDFGSKIKVPVLNRNQSARILGVYFNADDGHQTSGNYPISHFIIDPKYLMSHIDSLKNKGIMFLDHIITKDHAFLHDYNTIKKSLQHKGGKIPRWYTFLRDHITLDNHRLNVELTLPLIQNPTAARPSTLPTSQEIIYHMKRLQKWVMAWIPMQSALVYGKLLTTTHYPNCIPVSYIEHWIYKDLSSIVRNDTPRSLPTTIVQCPGCDQHFSYYVGNLRPKCILQIKHQDLLLVEILIPIRPYNPNDHLISSLILQDSIISELKNLALMLNDFTTLQFYTDGSYQNNNTGNEPPMGYGWILANHLNDNIFYSGSLKFFPSSTKAETMAILTALIICPPNSIVEIYTDSQAAIDAFHKSKNLHSISPRRFNKINNNILWSTIHHIIKKLSIKVSLFKVKAHSGDHYNDVADTLAKAGRLILTPTTVNHEHLPSQILTLEWNEEIPLDKDVRKCIGTIINYKKIEDHIQHPSLSFVKDATKNNLIDWSLSSKWFNFNRQNDSTSEKHTKDLKWKIRCSTLSLPTLDILNRNYPLLINNNITCLFCDSDSESNHHLWMCKNTREIIKECFITMGNNLIDLLNTHADKSLLLTNDSVKFSKTFRWAYRNEEIHPVAVLLLKSFVTNDIVGIFRSHFHSLKSIMKLLLPFIHECSILFKMNIWKKRNEKWKIHRELLGLTKKSFKEYYQTYRHNPSAQPSSRNRQRNNREFNYSNPFNSFRNFKLSKDFLYILFSSSNFLHSGPFFTHLKANDDITYNSPSSIDVCLFYNV